jgi:hypothetical protein
MKQMITLKQAEVLEHLWSYCSGDGDFEFFSNDVFPERNNQDSAMRRTTHKLAQAGILQQKPHFYANQYIYGDKAREAYREWYRKKGFNRGSFGFAARK